LEGIFYGNKSQKFQRYSEVIKRKALKMYEEQGKSYRAVANELGILNERQVKDWVVNSRRSMGPISKFLFYNVIFGAARMPR
jgi:transposase-like protein